MNNAKIRKTPQRCNRAEGKRLKNVLLFFNTPRNMDIFFFLYYISYGLPLGVVQVPHGVDADAVPSWIDKSSYINSPLCT